MKIFLCCPSDTDRGVKESLETSMNLLGLEFVESVIVSMPTGGEDADKKLKASWQQLESLVRANRVLTIGCSDISTQQLQELCEWAQVKPSTVQINLASCCVVPPEMTEFATQHDIRLLTHNDPQEILTNDSLRALLAKNDSIPSQQVWSIDWILRYAITIKGRGVIREKGYFLNASANAES
jgi:glutamate--cysteine ligase regulatory subunit